MGPTHPRHDQAKSRDRRAGPDSAITTAATRGSERMVLKRLTGRHQRVTLQRGLAGLAGEIGYFSSRDTPVSNYAPIAFASCWGQ
ncbi:hypothetical protein I545_3995 [Mycobacterium kansasii 662]|uniref:Uncharacterized protein n=2 Tax=Mycobacterium kansasii TaxID=1768 RepID=A0A1V3WHE2_MYCKA|nr:hypothetical protein I547_6203 [Mycobacterium kansasii 824]EUA17130.1 hypothetical protein I545_3995 [Mycobacterium kansasii 662]OOK66404.1 hypothetical protein BZL30_8051 [Mycobacterium kansasii]